MTSAIKVSSTRLRQLFGAHPTGVVFVSGLVNERPVGLAASSFTSVSLDPALVSISVAHTSTTWPLLRSLPRLGITVLSTDHAGVVRQLAGSGGDRFASLQWWSTLGGAVLLDGAAAWFEVALAQQVPAGDHDIVVLSVHEADVVESVVPLVFHASRFTGVQP